MKLITVKPIITDLSELDKIGRAEEIDIIKENKLMREIVAAVKRTMRKNNLTSLSAPALGYKKRIFCIDFSDKEIKTFINPLITNMDGIELTREVCSSIPGKEFIRPRNKTINMIYQNPIGVIKNETFKGLASHVVQHEMDHLEGITLADIGLEIDSDFDEATDEERFEIINMYLDSLDLTKDEIIKSAEDDLEFKILYENEKFAELEAQGKIEIHPISAEKDK